MGGVKNNESRSEIQNQGLQPHPSGRTWGRGGVRREKAGLGR